MLDDAERHRLVAWLAAEFEVQNGFDVSQDASVIARLQQAAELAAAATEKYEVNLPFLAVDATGPKHFHVVLTKSRIDDIRSGREGPPHVDRERRTTPPKISEPPDSRREPPKSDAKAAMLLVAFAFALALAIISFVILTSKHSHDEHEHDGHGQEHKR